MNCEVLRLDDWLTAGGASGIGIRGYPIFHAGWDGPLRVAFSVVDLDEVNFQRGQVFTALKELSDCSWQSSPYTLHPDADHQIPASVAAEFSFLTPGAGAAYQGQDYDPSSFFEYVSADIAQICLVTCQLLHKKIRAALSKRLRLLTRIAHCILRFSHIPSFISELFLLEEKWFFVHGTHPPDFSAWAIEGLPEMRGRSIPSYA
jgi:hypothetical protein